jgi:septum formation protein
VTAPPPLILASGSPQRRAILARLGIPFSVRVPEVTEREQGEAVALTLENARAKARAIRAGTGTGIRAVAGPTGTGIHAGRGELVLGCDTIVTLDGDVYGKPADRHGAERMLRALSGRTHEVVSGLVLLGGEGPGEVERERSVHAVTQVSFRELEEPLLAWYLDLEEWRGRAGSYAIQGAGAALVREVRGDYENVVGLPLAGLLDIAPELLAPL